MIEEGTNPVQAPRAPKVTPAQQLARKEQARVGGSFRDSHAREEKWEILLERQRELEEKYKADGGTRFWRRVEDAQKKDRGSTEGAEVGLLRMAITPLEVAIQHMIDSSKRPGQGTRGGRSHEAVRWCQAVGADVAAFMTVAVILNGATGKTKHRFPLSEAARSVSDRILHELRFREFQKLAPELLRYSIGKFATSSYDHMQRSLAGRMRTVEIRDADGNVTVGIDVSEWDMSPQKKVLVGAKLIELLRESTDILEYADPAPKKNEYGKIRRDWLIRLAPDTVKWLTARADKLEFLHPVNMPMIVPPLPWAPGVNGGGFRYALRGKLTLVSRASEERQRRIDSADMPLVYKAINLLQETAWKINTDVLELVEGIERKGGDMAKIPALEDEPDAVKPFDIEKNDIARQAYKQKQHAIIERNYLRGIRAKGFRRTLSVAHNMANESAIYFAHHLDWRGRVYPVSDYLSHQGNDLERALLTFARGKAVGSEGGKWLAIHGANCLGKKPKGVEKMSKLTLEERVTWINDHSAEICRCADDPFSHRLWSDADDPLQFFAFCKEWERYVESGRSEKFESGLPIALDATCNGLQHLAALLRDEIGGKAVNLAPGAGRQTPQDIYEYVVDTVKGTLEDAAASDPLAAKWLTSGLVTRDLTKRPTMIYYYGGTLTGFRRAILEELDKDENQHQAKAGFAGEDGKKSLIGRAALRMAQWIGKALPDVAPAASELMTWMRACVSMIAAQGKHVSWTVPLTGFPVLQEYFDTKEQQVRTVIAGKTSKLSVNPYTDKVKVSRHVNGIAPNYVHSLDAAALMLTVTRAASEGVESFGMIHDSYATVAGDYSVLKQATQGSFYRLHDRSPRPIESLYQELRAQMNEPDKCPPPPEPGTLDLGLVLASVYLFH